MLFARVEYKEVGPDFDKPDSLLDSDILRNCDETTIRSLNGCRVTDLILKTVPSKETFELTLRCIKLWSKHRGIHSNVLGYLGGVAWALLVAKICKDYPDAAANQVLNKFFKYYRHYEWNFNNPVTLCEIANDVTKVSFAIPQELIYVPQERQSMHVVTPAFPSMNSTYAVGISQKNVLLTEWEKAAAIMEEINGPNAATTRISWNRLFKKFPFFKAYEHFMEVQVLARNDDDHKKWQGFAEAMCLKRLVKCLEILDSKIGECLEFRPWPRPYKLHNEEYPYNDVYYIGIRIKGGIIPKKTTIDFSDTRKKFYEQFLNQLDKDYTVQDLLKQRAIDLRVDYKTRDQLPDEVRPKNAGRNNQPVVEPRQRELPPRDSHLEFD